ncbi:hypothetical protein [Haloglomus salinum]|uniref:hypothetical protein n=1 Tax=Haloglomus salinum TaxID=2962673 RepID=UPI0020C9D9DD|nr:hypothetical protein [Haloglomus salinum]
MSKHMERSRQQVLYQFLPGNTFDYSDRRGIWQVNRLETSDMSGRIDRQYILDRVLARAWNWDGGHQGFTSQNPDHYDFGEPESVRARPFPTTFGCRRCDKVHGYYSADQLNDENPELTCDNCGVELEQYQFVSVHSCGEIRRLYPQQCPTHGDQHIVLDTQGSQRAQNFHWRCDVGDCGWDTRVSYYQNCGCDYQPPDVSEDDNRMYTTVHRAGSTYYPHYITTVNLHTAGIGHLRESANGALKAIARLFGLSEAESLQSVDLDADIGDTEVDDDRLIEVYQTEPDVNGLDEAEEWLRDAGEIDSQSINRRLGELLDLDNEDDATELTDAGDELLQYVLSLESLTTHSLSDLRDDARDRGFPGKADRIDTYFDDIERLGIDAVRVIEDFPIQTFVYGYTRGSREEGEAKINAFSQNASDGDGTPIFVDTSETEAVQFDLDPAPVLLWLACNIPSTSEPSEVRGPVVLPEVDPTDADSVERARREISALDLDEQWAFIVNHLSPVDRYGRFETSTDDDVEGEVTAYIFQLLHTLSHILLKQASTISGFDRTNLSEFLFPRGLSVVIYANNREEFNIGGMNTMVEQQLDNLLGQAEAHGNDCLMDPVCSQRGGACLSCLHVSEISCSYFNQVLARDYLYGSRPNTDRDIYGYWEL